MGKSILLVSSTEVMSSPDSYQSSPPVHDLAEEPRKKGARGGKRSVTHLSKAQLARKRANDREAQRNIRQRTKEHIETLERRVRELEDNDLRSSSMERVMKRNEELENEIEKLKAQLNKSHAISPTAPNCPDISHELLFPKREPSEWLLDPGCPWPGPGANMPEVNPSPPYSSAEMYSGSAMAPAMGYVDDEASQQLYTPLATPIWQDPAMPGQSSQSLTKPTTAWAPFHASFSQPSRFAEILTSRFDALDSTPPTFPKSTSWQSQPSICAWQISTKLKAPITLVDQLMFSVIHLQRHLAITENLSGEDLIGPSFPSVHQLFNQPGPAKPPTILNETMDRYAAVLSKRGFARIPEKLASFMCMYRFVQWQISPTNTTYQALHEWQAPRPSQLMIPHPAWMDLPPWGKFRDKIIENQALYDNPEFQNDYASNMSVNWPYDPMKALIFEDGQIKVSVMMDKYLSDLSNMSMRKPFADKYPEFKDVCRFDEV